MKAIQINYQLIRFLQNRIVKFFLAECHCTVWELPLANAALTTTFINSLHTLFPPHKKFMPKIHLLVGNNKVGNCQSYLITGFDKDKWPAICSIINHIPGIVQDFSIDPEELILSAVVTDNFKIYPNVTSESVQRDFYGKA